MYSALRAGWKPKPSLLVPWTWHAFTAHCNPSKPMLAAGPKAVQSVHNFAALARSTDSAGLTCYREHCSASHRRQLPPLIISRHSVTIQLRQAVSVSTLCATSSSEPSWDSTWHDFLDELSAKGYATEAGSEDWGASKRAVLAFARSADLLPAIDLDGIRALVKTDIQYMDRKVRNARQRLSLLGGDSPTDVGTGEASFQDVMRLLMAIQLAGDSRTPDNEAAGAPVLRQALECLHTQPAVAEPPEKGSAEAGKAPVSPSRQRSGRQAKTRQARSWEAAPWSKSGR